MADFLGQLIVQVNRASNALAELWFWPLQGLPVWLQVSITAVPVTLFALLVFRFASDQAGIAFAKDQIKAHLLELWLYRDYPLVMLKAQGRVALNSFAWLGYSIVPLLVMLGPVALLLVQTEARFAYRAVAPGESVIVVADFAQADVATPELVLADGLRQETPTLRTAASATEPARAWWRVAGVAGGEHLLQLRILDAAGAAAQRPFAVDTASALAPAAYREGDWRSLGSPSAAPLPAAGPVTSLSIDYPRSRGAWLGLSSASWLLMGATLVLGYALRGVFGVTF